MNIDIRQVIVLPTLLHWRKEIITQIYGVTPSKALLIAARTYYEKHIADGSHIAIIAEADGSHAGFGAISITEELPTPDNPSGKFACLTDIYVREEYRRRGIAHIIVRWLVDKATQLGCGSIYLTTTTVARPLFAEIGFKGLCSTMQLKLKGLTL